MHNYSIEKIAMSAPESATPREIYDAGGIEDEDR
jgi:hypothetical protein